MLKICEVFSTEFNIEFNASKTKLIVFGHHPLRSDVSFQGKVISTVESEKHVGIFIGTDNNICKSTINKACGDLNARFNLFASLDPVLLMFYIDCLTTIVCPSMAVSYGI